MPKIKELPNNIDAEASILGCVLIDADALVKIADSISPDDFYDAGNAQIYKAILALYEKRSKIDVLTLADYLKNNGYLDMVGGPARLTELTNYVPTVAHVQEYADIVAEKGLRRRLIATSADISDLGQDETKSLKELVEEAEGRIFAVSKQRVKQSVFTIESVLAESLERLDNLHANKGKIRGIPTGFRDIDDMLAGLQRSDLFVLAARPSMGKTSMVLNIAHQVATQSKEAVLIFSLEMSKEQLVDRLLSMESGVDAWALRTGNLTDEDFVKLGEAMGKLGDAKILIDDTPGLTVSEMRTKAKREAHNQELGLVIVDYMQLMSGGGKFASSSNRVQEISEISRGLKGMARELNVPLIALSQLSRSVESRHPQIPQLADLRDSGSIEQDADIVAFLYREEYYNPETDRKNVLDFLVKKHRNGPTGSVELYFDREKQRIRSLHNFAKNDPFPS